MKIAGYIKTSLIEWPGKISSVIFTLGCNFRCPFCHNADLVDPAKFDKKMLLDKREVLDNLEKRKNWIDAVVITGGEPTLQTDLSKFLSRLKQMGFLTMLETNGTRPEILRRLLARRSFNEGGLSHHLVDYVAMDIKGDLKDYEKYTNVKCSDFANISSGKQMSKVKKSLELVAESGMEYELRTTVVPGLHDLENLKKLAEQLKSIIHNSKSSTRDTKWFLQQFRPINTLDKKFLEIKPFSKAELESLQKELQKIIPHTFLRGV